MQLAPAHAAQAPLVQVSPEEHDAHATPAEPHWLAVSLVRGMHCAPAQHPAQLPELHAPASELPASGEPESCAPASVLPASRAPPSGVPPSTPASWLSPSQLPLWQEVPALQTWHAAPPTPHWRLVFPRWQPPEESTQPSHDWAGRHAPVGEHCSSVLQTAHAAPLVPHAVCEVPVWQTSCWQHPEQLAGPHAPASAFTATHAPD